MKMRADRDGKVLGWMLHYLVSHPGLFKGMIHFLGRTQRVWNNKWGRGMLSHLPEKLLLTHIPSERQLPMLAKSSVRERYPELANLPSSEAEIAYFYGCSSDVFAEPIIDSFINIARHNHWKVALPAQRCCGEPFGAYGHIEECHKLARYNIDQLSGYKYVVAHCPSCIYGFKEMAKDFARIGDKVYEEKAQALVKKLYDPGQFIMEIIGPARLEPRTRGPEQKITVHQSCHEKLGQKMTATPNHMKNLLNLIPGAQVVEMQGASDCCGLAGPWGLGRHYDLTLKLRQEKINNVINSKADVVTSWCFGCMLQMRDGLSQQGSSIQAKHPLELLSEAYG
jgi:glycolate oxidase iron-sulfur subunit